MSETMAVEPGALPVLDPSRLIVCSGIESVVGHAKMAGLLDLGRAIAATLPGGTLGEKLAAFELGEGNRQEVRLPGLPGRLVLLRADIFGEGDFCQFPWSRVSSDLVRRYNQEMPAGGGALHPLHIIQHEVHRRLGGIVELGARDAATGHIELSERGLARIGLSAERAEELLADGAVLYAVID